VLDTIKLLEELRKHHQYEIISQTTRSVTSIGANFYESMVARTKKEFIGILGISLREAKESKYWLQLVSDLKVLSPEKLKFLSKELNEIISILTAGIKTSRRNLGNI